MFNFTQSIYYREFYDAMIPSHDFIWVLINGALEYFYKTLHL